ncbi:MAG: FAD-binding oxidoreductase [Candidatus Krumholzibacteriaceae bacterium]|jgi:FAD/FMN-containing dehydrogenase
MPRRVLTFAPRNAEEAAGIFRAVSAAAKAGRKIRAGIVESPFGPSAGVDLPAAYSSMEEIGRTTAAEETLALLSHAAMDGIQEISTKDFLAVVGGGVRFGELVEAVRAAGLYLPHEPAGAAGAEARDASHAETRCAATPGAARDATIAGIIMAGTSFRTEGRYGRLREYLLSLELVTPGGEIIRTGSRSVKDVTGYDVTGFLMGQGGLCGMIVKATIRLLPAPGTRLSFVCEGARGALESLAGEIRRKLSPAFLEMVDGSGGVQAREDSAAARLIGEIQSAVRGREEALLGNLSALAPEGVRVAKLDPAALEGAEAPNAEPPGSRPRVDDATGDRVAEELNRRLLRVFDPQGIMLP